MWSGHLYGKTYVPRVRRVIGVKPLKLTGIKIQVGKDTRFVGKVGICPDYETAPELSGRTIFYREEPWSRVYTRVAKGVAIDAEAWDYAKKIGAECMVVWCRDRACLVIVRGEEVSAAMKLDLKEGPEYRVKEDKCRIVENAGQVPMGFTRNSHILRSQSGRLPKLAPPTSKPKPETGQLDMFDF